MAAFRFPLIPASYSLPPTAPRPPSANPPPSSLPVVLFAGILLARRIAAATRKNPPSPGVLMAGLVVWMSARIRLRLDLLRWIGNLAPNSPDPPLVRDHDPPGSSRLARTLAWLSPLAGPDPDPVIQSVSQPEKRIPGGCLDPSRRAAVLLVAYIRAREPNQPKGQADNLNRTGYPGQTEPGSLQGLFLQPGRAKFWIQVLKPNESFLGWCEQFRRVWAQLFGPFTYA